jgi:tetratricopeptide (TPR) repeat protein
LISMNNLAGVLESQGKYEDAEAMNRQTLALSETVLGREHPSTLTSMSNLALVLRRQGKYEDAEAMNRQTLALSETVLGREHPDTLTTMYNLAYLLAKLRCYHESLALYERACAGYYTVLGHDHPTTRACHQHYAEAQRNSRRASCKILGSSMNAGKRKTSKLARGLAKIGIESLKPSSC